MPNSEKWSRDNPDLYVTEMPLETSFSIKSRFVWLTRSDWQAFADALIDAYPQARYHGRSQPPSDPKFPSTWIYDRHLMDVPIREKYDDISMIFDPDWQPEYRLCPWPGDPPEKAAWWIINPSYPRVLFERSTAPTAEELEVMTDFRHSRVSVYCLPDNNEHATAAQRFFRLLGKFCTNRNQAHYKMPDWNLRWIEPKGSMYWFGHDAIRWAHGDPERAMYYLQKTWAIRPLTNEQVVELSRSVPTTPTA